MTTHRQFTLWELLLLIVFVAAALGALSSGGVLASVVLCAALITTTGVAIVAFVARDELRASAIGFLIPVVAYAAMIVSIGSSEFDPYEGRLPTTKLLLPAHRLIVKREWVNVTTGDVVPNYDPATDPNRGGGGFGTPIGLRETPDRAEFMSLAHVLLALTFGYAGAKFAGYIYRRQSTGHWVRNAPSHTAKPSAGPVSNEESSTPAR